MTPPTSTITQDEYDALKVTLAARDAEIEQLREALEHWVFLYGWKAEGMNIEQAKIHAGAFMMTAALQPKESLKARIKKVEAIRDGLIMETWLKGIDAALQHKEDNQ